MGICSCIRGYDRLVRLRPADIQNRILTMFYFKAMHLLLITSSPLVVFCSILSSIIWLRTKCATASLAVATTPNIILIFVFLSGLLETIFQGDLQRSSISINYENLNYVYLFYGCGFAYLIFTYVVISSDLSQYITFSIKSLIFYLYSFVANSLYPIVVFIFSVPLTTAGLSNFP